METATLKIGDRVRLRGRRPRGTLLGVNPQSQWARVEWDPDAAGPTCCHVKELEREVADTQ